MVRTYKRIAGSRNYKNYTEQTLEQAIEQITNGEVTINAASIKYKIPFGTLYNKYKGLHGRTPGGQPVFTHQEETAILRAAATCADWGFPLTLLDLRMFAKSYLDKQGKIIERFANNMPGVEWAVSLLKRHKNAYGQRLSSNIKRSRATVGRVSLNKYFDNLGLEIENVSPSNIFNYDESNMADDPGKKKCIYKRGVKYPEKIMNFSKSCTTVMVCGSADGTLLPPYVIYKSVHLYDTWKERGIVGKPCCEKPCCSRGSKYNRTISGWIDTPTFRDWFMTCFLPHANRLEGKKVLIGDNLSSHLDDDVLAACAANNINFICLVPNSTHICQPLDVGFFRPLKLAWRQTLEQWKQANVRATTVPKEAFPNLLKQSLQNMDKKPPKKDNDDTSAETSAIKRNLISSFKATGIYPYNRERVLRKLPRDSPSPEVENTIRDSLTTFLRERRFEHKLEPARKKKRLQVEPGKSISTIDGPLCSRNQDVEADVPEESGLQSPSAVAVTNKTSSSNLQPFHEINDDDDDDVTDCESLAERTPVTLSKEPVIGQFILAKFISQKGKRIFKYVCSIEDICDHKLVVQGYKSIKKSKTLFREVPNDVSIIEESEIVAYLPTPKFNNDCYTFPSNVMIKEL